MLFTVLSYADISDSINLGQTKTYITPEKDFIIAFTGFDPLKQRSMFQFNDGGFNLLLGQSVNYENFSFTLTGASGESLDDFAVSFLIENVAPFECILECKNNSFVNFLRFFKPDTINFYS